jgi:hypothetical protein
MVAKAGGRRREAGRDEHGNLDGHRRESVDQAGQTVDVETVGVDQYDIGPYLGDSLDSLADIARFATVEMRVESGSQHAPCDRVGADDQQSGTRARFPVLDQDAGRRRSNDPDIRDPQPEGCCRG